MTNKVTINSLSSVAPTGTTFIVTDANDFKALTDKGHQAVYFEFPKGLTNWTKAQGVDLDTLRTYGTGHHFAMLVARVDQNESKVQNFITELRSKLEDLGHTLKMPAMPAGLSVSRLIDESNDHDKSLAQRAASDSGFNDVSADEDDEGQTEVDPNENGARAAYFLAKAHFTPVTGKDRRVYMIPKTDKPEIGRRAYELGSTALRQRISGLYFQKYGNVFSSREHGSVEDLLADDANRNRAVLSIETRSFRDDSGAVIIDLGQKNCETLYVCPEGWSPTKMPSSDKCAFVLNEAVRPIQTPKPVFGVPDAIKNLNARLRPLVNVEDRDWPLIVGWMVNHLIAGSNSPILMLLGTNGSGKSTACNAINFAVEGGSSVPDSLEFSGKKDDVMVTLSKHKVAVFDNVSKISADLSDNLAQVVYGKTYQKRKLRTDDDVVDLYIKSSVIMNGISTGQLREDLKDRMVVLNLAGTVEKQMDIYSMKAAQVKHHPETFGSLLTLTSAVMKVLSENEVPPLQSRARMDDYARVLWALDFLLGTESVARYLETLDESASDAQDDPLLWHAVALIRRQETYDVVSQQWTGMLGTKALMDSYNSDNETWNARLSGVKVEPLTARTIPEKLTRVQAEWARLGVEIRMGEKKRTTIDGRQQTAYPVIIHPKAAEIVREARSRDYEKNGYADARITD